MDDNKGGAMVINYGSDRIRNYKPDAVRIFRDMFDALGLWRGLYGQRP